MVKNITEDSFPESFYKFKPDYNKITDYDEIKKIIIKNYNLRITPIDTKYNFNIFFLFFFYLYKRYYPF